MTVPSDWLYIDTNFPSFTGEEDLEEKVSTIQNYLFMLVEQFRYTLNNLDLSNMNSTAVEQFSSMLTKPIYAQISDAEGNLTKLGLTAEGLAGQISDIEGDMTQFSATAKGLVSQVSDIEENVSAILQMANSLTLNVSNGSTSSTISLKAGDIELASEQIIMSGIVAYTEDGSPTYAIMKSEGLYLYHTDVENPKAVLTTNADGSLVQLILGAGSSADSETAGRFYIQKGISSVDLYYCTDSNVPVGFTFNKDGTISVHGSLPVTAVFA